MVLKLQPESEKNIILQNFILIIKIGSIYKYTEIARN